LFFFFGFSFFFFWGVFFFFFFFGGFCFFFVWAEKSSFNVFATFGFATSPPSPSAEDRDGAASLPCTLGGITFFLLTLFFSYSRAEIVDTNKT